VGGKNGWLGRATLRTAAATLMALLVSVELSAQPRASERVRVEGDARAWEEITSAWRRLQDLRGYRVRMRNVDGTLEMVFEFERSAQGGKVRVVTTVRQGGQEFRTETVRVGDSAWQVMPMPRAGASCRQIPPDRVPPGPSLFPEPGGGTAAEEVVWARRVGPGTSPRGAPVTVYEWRSRKADEADWKVSGTLHVDRASGLPAWMSFETDRQKFTAEYYDFNAPVQVTKPAGC
jgi:hypothetical protein